MLLTAVLLQPTPHRLSTTVAGDLGDSIFLTWTLSWGADALITDPFGVFDANIFHPHADTLAFSDPMLSLAPVFGLLKWTTGDAITALNVLMVLLFLFALVSTHALGRRLLGREDLAIVVAVVGCCNSYVFGQQNHPQLQTFGFIALGFLVLFRAIEKRRPRDGVALAAVTVALALANLVYGLIWVFSAVLAVATLAIRRALPPLRSLIAPAVPAVVLTAVVLGPMALTYRSVANEHGLSRRYEPQNSLGAADLITPHTNNWSWGSTFDSVTSHMRREEHAFFPGFVVLALGVIGIVMFARAERRSERAAGGRDGKSNNRVDEIAAVVVAGAGAALLAIGPSPKGLPGPFRFFHAYVPAFDGVRVTSRFAIVTLLAAALIVALGFGWVRDRLASKHSVRAASYALPLVVLLIAVEVGGPMRRVEVPDGDRLLVYEALAAAEPGPVLELPIHTPDEGVAWPIVEATRMYHGTTDFNPRVNGYSGGAPAGFDQLGDVLNQFPSPEAMAELDDLGVRYVVLHTGDEQGYSALTPVSAAEIAELVGSLGASASRFGEDWLIDLAD